MKESELRQDIIKKIDNWVDKKFPDKLSDSDELALDILALIEAARLSTVMRIREGLGKINESM